MPEDAILNASALEHWARRIPLLGIARSIVATRMQGKDNLFVSQSGRVLTASHVGQALIARRANAPLDHFTTHDMRRTFVSQTIELGPPVEVIAAIVGHESGGRDTRTLFKHYVKTDMIERKIAALSAWDLVLSGMLENLDEVCQ